MRKALLGRSGDALGAKADWPDFASQTEFAKTDQTLSACAVTQAGDDGKYGGQVDGSLRNS